MFCLKCGNQIDDNAMKCPFCNCPTENAGAPIESSVTDDSIKSANGLGTVSVALGIVGCIMAWLLAALGYIFGGAALALALIARNKNQCSQNAKRGLIISIAALACSLISSITGMIILMSM